MTDKQAIKQQVDAFDAELIDIEIELTAMKRLIANTLDRIEKVKTAEDARLFNEWYQEKFVNGDDFKYIKINVDKRE